jgi:hypothetical protein
MECRKTVSQSQKGGSSGVVETDSVLNNLRAISLHLIIIGVNFVQIGGVNKPIVEL